MGHNWSKSLSLKYLGCVLGEFGTDIAKCHRNVVSGRKVAVAIMSLINARGLQLECVKVEHEALLVPVQLYGNKTQRSEKEKSRIRPVQLDNFRDLLNIMRMNRVQSEKDVDERTEESFLHWFNHIERIRNAKIAKRIYV